VRAASLCVSLAINTALVPFTLRKPRAAVGRRSSRRLLSEQQRNKRFGAVLTEAVIPGITMVGSAPLFFKILVTEAFVDAVTYNWIVSFDAN
jgi:hypothetical protein